MFPAPTLLSFPRWVKAGLRQPGQALGSSLDQEGASRRNLETMSAHLIQVAPILWCAALYPMELLTGSWSLEISFIYKAYICSCFCHVNTCNHYLKYHKSSLSPFLSACLSTICLFKFFLNKKGISLCLFVGIFYIHLLFTSFVFLRCLQQILAGCTVCVINKTAVKILTVRPNCQPWLGAKFIPGRMQRLSVWASIQIWPLQLALHLMLWPFKLLWLPSPRNLHIRPAHLLDPAGGAPPAAWTFIAESLSFPSLYETQYPHAIQSPSGNFQGK